uniref:Uncharacterized protein n=2 Tax=Brassica oleracea TaxID=3712 RepID=A0A0D2ZPM6_BRAOL|nr:unnamed protein product [Brassica oleracea]
MSLRWLTKFTFSTLFDQVLRRIERPQKAAEEFLPLVSLQHLLSLSPVYIGPAVRNGPS